MKAKFTPIVGFTKTISMAEARAMYPSEPAVVAQADPKHADIYAALRAAGLSLVKTAHGLHVTELIEGEASTVYPQLGAAPSDAALNDAYAEGRKDEREETLSKLRDEFAAAAIMKLSTDWQPESAARLAYQLADAMLKARTQ